MLVTTRNERPARRYVEVVLMSGSDVGVKNAKGWITIARYRGSVRTYYLHFNGPLGQTKYCQHLICVRSIRT